jgi:carbon monoxide dehydrogenase subunit G
MIVDFEMRLPWPLANSKYSTGNIFSRLERNEYQICWYLVKSDSLIDSKGTVQFIPYAQKTLLKYQALIHPDSKLASILSSQVRSRVTKTVQAIVTYIEETKKKDPEKTQELVNALHK